MGTLRNILSLILAAACSAAMAGSYEFVDLKSPIAGFGNVQICNCSRHGAYFITEVASDALHSKRLLYGPNSTKNYIDVTSYYPAPNFLMLGYTLVNDLGEIMSYDSSGTACLFNPYKNLLVEKFPAKFEPQYINNEGDGVGRATDGKAPFAFWDEKTKTLTDFNPYPTLNISSSSDFEGINDLSNTGQVVCFGYETNSSGATTAGGYGVVYDHGVLTKLTYGALQDSLILSSINDNGYLAANANYTTSPTNAGDTSGILGDLRNRYMILSDVQTAITLDNLEDVFGFTANQGVESDNDSYCLTPAFGHGSAVTLRNLARGFDLGVGNYQGIECTTGGNIFGTYSNAPDDSVRLVIWVRTGPG